VFFVNPANCTANPLIGKILSAGIVNISGTSSTLRVSVQGPPLNNAPIPDGPLYTCTFDILPGAAPLTYTLTNGNFVAQDPNALPVGPITGSDGQITVVLVGQTLTPSSTPTETPTPTETGTPTETPTDTPTPTETGTVTETPTPSETPTITQTPVSILISIGDGVGLAGQTVDIPVTLNSTTLGVSVAGTGNDITFDNSALTIDPTDCFPNPLIGKILSAAIVNVSGTSSTLRVFVQGPPINNDPIPDGLLYTCRFEILGGTLPNIYPLIFSGGLAQDDNAMPVGPVAGEDGQILVALVGPTYTPSPTPTITETPSVTPTDTPTDTPTSTPTDTPTNTPTFTPTNTPTDTPTPTPTEPPPRLEISAVVSRDPIGPGQLLTYTILFSNAGGRANMLTVTANTPPGTTFESASPLADSAPAVGGTGTVTWTFPTLPTSGGGMVLMTVRVDANLASGTMIVFTGYQIECADPPGIMPEIGPDIATTVQTDLTLEIAKLDDPDGVAPGAPLTYELIIANRGGTAIQNIVVRELFDPNLIVVSSLPAPDLGTDDRWSIPFLPAGAARTISITTEVQPDAEPGIIIRNMAQMEDELGRVTRKYEDTLIVGPQVLGMSIDDLPDPVRPGEELVYAISYSNISSTDITGVTVYAEPDPNLVFQSASPAPSVAQVGASYLQWDVGDMMSTSAERIFASFTVNPTMPTQLFPGTLIPMRTWVMDDGGNVASALEVTLYRTEPGPDSDYLLNLSGGPRNLRIGVVDTMVYVIKLSHEGVLPTTNVVINNALPPALDFVESDPPPTSIEGNLISFRFATVQPGETKLIVLKAQVGPTAVAGSTLTNRVYVVDDQANTAQATFVGGIRPGTAPSDGKLQLSLTIPNNITVVGDRPSNLKSSVIVTKERRGHT
jgi:uncharacterized repeat protein (TIGR01451 family)